MEGNTLSFSFSYQKHKEKRNITKYAFEIFLQEKYVNEKENFNDDFVRV